jgi:hypothetical protein
VFAGCGAYYSTSCDRQGIDLMNAEASALFQSFPGFDGSPIGTFFASDKRVQQPGTVGFQGGPVCTRFERGKATSSRLPHWATGYNEHRRLAVLQQYHNATPQQLSNVI